MLDILRIFLDSRGQQCLIEQIGNQGKSGGKKDNRRRIDRPSGFHARDPAVFNDNFFRPFTQMNFSAPVDVPAQRLKDSGGAAARLSNAHARRQDPL